MVRIQAAALLWAWAQISSGGNSGASAASDTSTLLPLLCTHQHDASRTSLAHMLMPLFTGVRGRRILRTSPCGCSPKEESFPKDRVFSSCDHTSVLVRLHGARVKGAHPNSRYPLAEGEPLSRLKLRATDCGS